MYENILKNSESIEENFLELEKEFLIFFNRRINKIETREEIINVIYELRYMKYIPIKDGKIMSDIDILNNAIDRILKKAVTRACKMGVIKIISMDIALNYEILKYALDTRIINLEQIKMSFEVQEKFLIIKVLDKEVFEKQGRKRIENVKDLLEVKMNRKIKIFN